MGYNGTEVQQEQWYNNVKLEALFSDGGMDVKVIRMNTRAFLLADMGEGYELVGKMYIPADQPTRFALYNNNTAIQVRNYSLRTGQDAALAALDGIDLKVDVVANAFAVPVDGTQWTIEGKVSFADFAVSEDYRFAVSGNKTDKCRMNLLYFYSQSKWRGQSYTQVSGSWASADIPNGDTLTGDGLWTRWVRDGATLSLYVSTDGASWTYVQNCDNCGTASGVIYIFEANGDQTPVMEDLTIRAGLPE